jgi:hypothetical protein
MARLDRAMPPTAIHAVYQAESQAKKSSLRGGAAVEAIHLSLNFACS